jgi:hypothetical protein
MVLRWTSYQRIIIIIIIIIAWPDCIMLVNKDAPFVYFFLVCGPPAEQNLCSAILYELYLDTYLRGMVVFVIQQIIIFLIYFFRDISVVICISLVLPIYTADGSSAN